MCNRSLEEGCLRVSQRHAIVTPRLKKAGANQSDVKTYRSISNLTFMSTIVDKFVCGQLFAVRVSSRSLDGNGRSENYFRLMAVDCGQATILGFLDLSAVFDTVDQITLIDRLRRSFGIKLVVLPWIESFIRNRTQKAIFAGCLSSASSVTCGVP